MTEQKNETKREKPIYELIKRRCKKKGITVTRAEQDLGLSKGYLCKIDVHAPSMSNVAKICEYLGLAPDELISGQEGAQITPIEIHHDVPDGDYSNVTVIDASMSPILHKGDILRVVHQKATTPSDLTVVQIGRDITVRYMEYDDTGVWLRARNSTYGDHHYSVQDIMRLPIAIIGKAVSFERVL